MSKYIHFERHADFFVVSFLDKNIHDFLAITEWGDELMAVVGRPDCSKLVLNLSGVKFLSGGALAKLLSVNRILVAKGGLLRLCELFPDVREVFRITKLDLILGIRDTEAEALEP